ncbi:hypothetical protein V5P93_001087 [Actinokineospora auranticolor]|uniref:Uncharacterized protein n=1 Tax=Actinokineospora auranticolor TaxID=155976 RepID=A0A2S6GDV0_9PSEU|nr:hypothetical protein [Actinokineospora auranticolor]PPK63412.1 hypothetical protein CLV40_12824 [Actinokineospora auranticolor]
MRIRTDDEVYRVDAVWLGPPKATFPWRARYVAWGVGTVVFLIALTVLRNVGVGLFWSFAWGLVATVALTMVICSRISHERPLGAVLTMWLRELNTPREQTTGTGGAVSAAGVRVRAELPRRKPRGSDRGRAKNARRAEEARRKAREARAAGATRQPRPGKRTAKKTQKQRNREVSGVRTP